MLDAIVIMAKAPLPGVCKTRLARHLGEERAAALYERFLLDTVDLAREVPGASVAAVCPDAGHAGVLRAILPAGVAVEVQEGDGLLAGLAWALAAHLRRGFARVVLIDGDSPTLPPAHVADALRQLDRHDLVLGPCDDGGYYLVGARAPRPELFVGAPYRSDTICAETAARARGLGLTVALAPPWYDVDTRADYDRLLADLATTPSPAPRTRAFLGVPPLGALSPQSSVLSLSDVDRWTHCPYCGGPLETIDEEGRRRQRCPACRRVLYRNPVPAAGCVVERDGRVLLARRRHPPWEGHWYFPSGFVEYDEDVAGTARRETREETGLEVAVDGVFGAYSYFDDPRKNGIIILFRARVVGGELRPGDDAADARFFGPHELPEPVGFASHRRALAEWRAGRAAEDSPR